MSLADPEQPVAYNLIKGRTRSPLILSVPHSGNVYPPDFLEANSLSLLRASSLEDWRVADLISPGAQSVGLPLLAGRVGRAYLDLNRDPEVMDPSIFAEPLPPFVKTNAPIIASGYTVLPRVTADGIGIYRRPLTWKEAKRRLDHWYHPYHHKLRKLIEQTRRDFGYVLLLDFHSMPRPSGFDPDKRHVVLGDCHGRSAQKHFRQIVTDKLEDLGYCLGLNDPYAGGYTTQCYGRPEQGVNVLQIEIDRSLYMRMANGALPTAIPGWVVLEKDLSDLLSYLYRYVAGL